MRKSNIDWSIVTEEDLEVLEENFSLLPKRLIVRLREEYKQDLFSYCYEELLKICHEGEYPNFFDACQMIEMYSQLIYENEDSLKEWTPKEYYYYLSRKEIPLEHMKEGEEEEDISSSSRAITF